jgi:hypothetical protein
MREAETASKVKSRIAEWQSCVQSSTSKGFGDAPSRDGGGSDPPAERQELALLPVGLSGTTPRASTPEGGPHLEDLRRSLAVERDRASALVATVQREQALHAATLYLHGEKLQQQATPERPNREALEAAMRLAAAGVRQDTRVRRRRYLEALAFALLAAAAAGCGFLAHLW